MIHFIIGGTALLGYVVYKVVKRSQRKQLDNYVNNQNPMSEEEFVLCFPSVDSSLVKLCRSLIIKSAPNKKIDIYPDFELSSFLRLGQEDIKNVAIDASLEFNIPYPKSEHWEFYIKTNGKINTVEQLIFFIDEWVKKHH